VSSLHSENYSTSKPLKVYPEKSQILSCDTVVAIERCVQVSAPYEAVLQLQRLGSFFHNFMSKSLVKIVTICTNKFEHGQDVRFEFSRR